MNVPIWDEEKRRTGSSLPNECAPKTQDAKELPKQLDAWLAVATLEHEMQQMRTELVDLQRRAELWEGVSKRQVDTIAHLKKALATAITAKIGPAIRKKTAKKSRRRVSK